MASTTHRRDFSSIVPARVDEKGVEVKGIAGELALGMIAQARGAPNFPGIELPDGRTASVRNFDTAGDTIYRQELPISR
jgi:hypothetical protein